MDIGANVSLVMTPMLILVPKSSSSNFMTANTMLKTIFLYTIPPDPFSPTNNNSTLNTAESETLHYHSLTVYTDTASPELQGSRYHSFNIHHYSLIFYYTSNLHYQPLILFPISLTDSHILAPYIQITPHSPLNPLVFPHDIRRASHHCHIQVHSPKPKACQASLNTISHTTTHLGL